MISDELKYRILSVFGHEPTVEQEHAIGVFTTFMTDRCDHAAMLLRGSAGTGKTTLAAAVVRAMGSMEQQLVLLAPTGRAAKVFSHYSGHPAYTIHRHIYRQKSLMDGFELGYNNRRDTLFIVDEASMISTYGDSPEIFGSSLLDDLIRFVYNGRNCRLMLIGDPAQLPPVGQQQSPALQNDVLQDFGLNVHTATLNEVLRQSSESGILWNATIVRSLMQYRGGLISLPQIRFDGFPDICTVPGDELIESLASSYSQAGMDDTLVVTRSNKRANIYNQGIRNTILDREDLLCRGDRIMVVKNNYHWTPKNTDPEVPTLDFIANGDMAVVQRVRNIHELYGFHFAQVTMSFPDYNDYELTATVLLDTLTAEAPALTREQQEQLFQAVWADYADIRSKIERMKKLKEDPYFNALQIKFAYAATCHKAQGGQWSHVYIDQGYMTDDTLTPDYLRWLYTAMTRATSRLFFVNWPKQQTEGHVQ